MINKSFLSLYNEELRYLRDDGQRFAKMHPQVAQHLGLHSDGILDPFVERLLEGTAFLSARIQHRLDNEYPEFALQMLSRLAPTWYTPLPSIATIAMTPDLTSPQWHSHVVLPKGSRVIMSDNSLNNRKATFSTGREIKLQPLLIDYAEMTGTPTTQLPHAVARQLQHGQACLRLCLSTQGVASLPELDFSPMNLTLSGNAVHANQLLTTLLNDTAKIVIWSRRDKSPLLSVLKPAQLRLGGLTPQESLLPGTPGEMPGGRLLREYFAAPSRFFDLELQGINDFLQQGEGLTSFEILFVLNQRPLHLIDRVSHTDFRLFATPVINLFKRRCSPVLVNHEHTEYPIVADALNPQLYEIHHVAQVNGLLAEGGNLPFSSLHGSTHFGDDDKLAGYSIRRRREFTDKKRKNGALPYDSLFISLSPGNSGQDIDRVKSLSIEAMVCERHLIPYQLQHPEFQLDIALPVGAIELLRTPSRPQGVPDIAQAWKVLQLIANNPLRYAQPAVEDCSALIKEWLSLFCQSEDASQQKRITSINHASITHRFERSVLPGPIAWARGIKATLDINSQHHSDKGAYLFAYILHYALSEYCELGQTLSMEMQLDGKSFATWGPVIHA